MLREFSAPVKLKFNYTDHDLALLFKHDTDLFNRWEAGQRYAVNVILKLVADHQQGKVLHVPEDYLQVINHVLLSDHTDLWLLTEMLTLPSERYLAEQMAVVDVDAIFAARESVMAAIALHFKNHFIALYEKHHDLSTPYQFNMQAVGQRYLKNLCLAYLMLLKDKDIYQHIGMKQFTDALMHNMTDTLAALRALVNADCVNVDVHWLNSMMFGSVMR